jgi:type III pantothenate kinase
VKTGMPILYENPSEVGADRIVNGVAAFERFGGPCIVVDFGTATTFDAVSKKGEYMGGIIAPGIGIGAEALFVRTARLPRVDIRKPQKNSIIGTNTVASLQAGLYYGYVGLVDGILERLIAELADIAVAEASPRQEGNQMHVILSGRAGRKTAPKRATQEAVPEPVSEE